MLCGEAWHGDAVVKEEKRSRPCQAVFESALHEICAHDRSLTQLRRKRGDMLLRFEILDEMRSSDITYIKDDNTKPSN